jgi:septal ring factor EnvC (AmiA/AmiB activator)
LLGVRALAALAALFAAAIAGGPTTRADDPARRLKTLEDEIQTRRDQEQQIKEKQVSLAQEMQRLQAVLVLAARTAREREAALAAVEGKVAQIADEYASHRYELAARRGEVASVLAALARIARVPPATALGDTLSTTEAIRGAMLLRAALPEIDARAAGLRRDLALYSATVDQLQAERTVLEDEKKAIDAERERLDGLIAQRRAVGTQLGAEETALRIETERLSGEAQSLRDLIERIHAERRKMIELSRVFPRSRAPGPSEPLESALGAARFPYPVFGEVVRGFGDPTESGHPSVGLVLATLPSGTVVAPYGGRIVFAGTFRGYGQLLILEIAEGYHVLLSGFARIDVATGQNVVVGEPVGVMGETGSGLTSLYFELRRDGQPINPLPWLADRNAKVRG